MATWEFSSLSRETLRVRVSAMVNGVAVNPTTDVVEFAFISGGGDPSTEWKAGSWDTDTAPDPDTYKAQIEVGPGSLIGTLAKDLYAVWTRVTDSPEIPVHKVGILRIY